MTICTSTHIVYSETPCLPETGFDAGAFGLVGLLLVVAGLALRTVLRGR